MLALPSFSHSYIYVCVIESPILTLSVTSSGKPSLIAGVMVLFILHAATNILSFTSMFLLVNHSADSDLVGTANGMAQSVASLARGLGPLIGGLILSWSLSNGLKFPFDHYFSFFVWALLHFSCTALSLALPKSIDSRKK